MGLMHRNKNQNKFRQQNNCNNKIYKKKESEVDFHRITQRMRQIDIGKATPEYMNYISMIPKTQRSAQHPRTPNPREKMPNKWWKKKMNDWRKALHAFDVKEDDDNNEDDKSVDDKKKENCVNFCCEKCSKEFVDFDEWQKHRKICKGKVDEKREKNVNDKENVDKIINGDLSHNVVADFDDDDSSSFDMFKMDDDIDLDQNEDVDLKEKECANTDIKVVDSKDGLLDALNDVLGDSDDDLF